MTEEKIDTKNATETDEEKEQLQKLDELKGFCKFCQDKVASIKAKGVEYRAALEKAQNTVAEITKKIAGAVVDEEPTDDLREQLTKAQGEVVFLTGMADEIEGKYLTEAGKDLKNANVLLEEEFIRFMLPQRQTAIDEALTLHARVGKIKEQWPKYVIEATNEYGIKGFAVILSTVFLK